MIESIKCIKNLGPFERVEGVKLGKFTLVYGENGRGKTMLSEVFRSLATGAPELVEGRKRLGADADPVVVLETRDKEVVHWSRDSWLTNGELPKVSVFNDGFVDANVYSGLDVSAAQRQGLHSVVVGEEGRKKAEAYKAAGIEIDRVREKLKRIASEITDKVVTGIPVEEFVALTPCDEIDALIADNQALLNSAKRASVVGQRPQPNELPLLDFPVNAVQKRLQLAVDDVVAEASKSAKAHLSRMWTGAESWVHTGWVNRDDSGLCPFCKQDLSSSPVLSIFEHYFSDAYRDTKHEVSRMLEDCKESLSDARWSAFDRLGEENARLIDEWVADGIPTPASAGINHPDVSTAIKSLGHGMVRALRAKVNAPLELVEFDEETRRTLQRLPEYERSIREENDRIAQINRDIKELRDCIEGSNLNELRERAERLKLIEARGSETALKLCKDFAKAQRQQDELVSARTERLEELKRYNEGMFREYAESINTHLARFGAGFSIVGMKDTAAGGAPTCEFVISIEGGEVPVRSKMPPDDRPSFRNTLSAGDRTSLALAFFLASLERVPNLEGHLVVVDDPVSSLDDGRRSATITRIRRYGRSDAQLIVLSHDARFLARIAEGMLGNSHDVLSYVIRYHNGNPRLDEWDIASEAEDEATSRASRLQRFANDDDDDPMVISREIRLHLETVLPLLYPVQCPVGTMLGEFVTSCRQDAKNGREVIPEAILDHMDELREFSNKPHHVRSERSNQTELRAWVKSMLALLQGAQT